MDHNRGRCHVDRCASDGRRIYNRRLRRHDWRRRDWNGIRLRRRRGRDGFGACQKFEQLISCAGVVQPDDVCCRQRLFKRPVPDQLDNGRFIHISLDEHGDFIRVKRPGQLRDNHERRDAYSDLKGSHGIFLFCRFSFIAQQSIISVAIAGGMLHFVFFKLPALFVPLVEVIVQDVFHCRRVLFFDGSEHFRVFGEECVFLVVFYEPFQGVFA